MADMSANSDDDAVDALTTYVHASFAAPLARIQATASATVNTGHAGIGFDGATLDALVPALRKAHPTSNSSNTPAPPIPDTTAWKRVLLMVFRRFAGHIVVRGKLLNQEELLVSHFCRVNDAVSGRPHGACVHIPKSLSSLRFILPCEDGPVEQVGRDDVVARVKAASYPASVDAEVVVVACGASSGRYEEDLSATIIPPFVWEDARALTDLDTLFDFDVRYLLQSQNTILSRLTDQDEESANVVIVRAPAFSDLRCTQVMMRSYGIHQSSNSSSAMGRFESFAIETSGDSETNREEHPRSYISLGKAQKKRWADERLASGLELVGKGRTKDALAEFSSCLKLEEEHVGAFFARAEAFAALQQFPEAIRDLEKARRLDPAFPGLAEALARARSKLKHSRHVEIPSSLVGSKSSSLAASGSHSFKSRSRSKAHSDNYSKGDTARDRGEKTVAKKNPSQDNDSERVRRSQSSSSSLSSLSKPRAATESDQYHQSKEKKELERDRLRHLLEEAVEGERDRKEKRRRRKKSTRASYSSDDDDSEASSDGSSINKKRKSSSSSSKKKKKRKHDERRARLSRKSKKKKNRRRHRRSDDSSSDSSSDSDSSSESGRGRKHGRKKKRRRGRSSSNRRDRSESRGRGLVTKDNAPLKEEEPHPILARPRHRIWN